MNDVTEPTRIDVIITAPNGDVDNLAGLLAGALHDADFPNVHFSGRRTIPMGPAAMSLGRLLSSYNYRLTEHFTKRPLNFGPPMAEPLPVVVRPAVPRVLSYHPEFIISVVGNVNVGKTSVLGLFAKMLKAIDVPDSNVAYVAPCFGERTPDQITEPELLNNIEMIRNVHVNILARAGIKTEKFDDLISNCEAMGLN